MKRTLEGTNRKEKRTSGFRMRTQMVRMLLRLLAEQRTSCCLIKFILSNVIKTACGAKSESAYIQARFPGTWKGIRRSGSHLTLRALHSKADSYCLNADRKATEQQLTTHLSPTRIGISDQ